MNIEKLNEKYMYKDTAQIFREQEVINKDHSTSKKLAKVCEINCRISRKKQEHEKGELLFLDNALVLFTSPGEDIKAGDLVKVTKGLKEYTAGKPYEYEHHIEVILKKKGVN